MKTSMPVFRQFLGITCLCVVLLSLSSWSISFAEENDSADAKTGLGQGTKGDKSWESTSSTTTKGPETDKTTTSKTVETPPSGDTRKVTDSHETTWTSKGSAGEVKVTSGQSQSTEVTGKGQVTTTDKSSSSVSSGGSTTTKETSTSTTKSSDGSFQSTTVKGSLTYEKPIASGPDKEKPPSSSVTVGGKLGETSLFTTQKGALDSSQASGVTKTTGGTELGGSATFQSGQYSAEGKGTLTVDKDGVKAGASVSGEANIAKGEAVGKIEKQITDGATVKGEVKGTATVGVKGSADASLQVGPDQISASTGGKAFAGVELTASATGTVDMNDSLGISLGGTVKGSASAGVGAEGKASLSLSWTKIEVNLGAGATAGLGLKGEGSVTIDGEALITGQNPVKVSLQDKVDGAIMDVAKLVSKGELEMPPGTKFSDIVNKMKEQGTLYAKNPQLDENGKEKNLATLLVDQFGFQKPTPKPQQPVVQTPVPGTPTAPQPAINVASVSPPVTPPVIIPGKGITNDTDIALYTNVPPDSEELVPPPPITLNTNIFNIPPIPTEFTNMFGPTKPPDEGEKPEGGEDLASSEPTAPTGTASTAAGPGKKPVVDDFIDFLTEIALSDTASGYNTMQGNTQIGQASTSGDGQLQGGKDAVNAAGAEGQTVKGQTSMEIAQANSAAGWGATVGNALQQGFEAGGSAFGGVIGTGLASHASSSIFGKPPTSSSSGGTSTSASSSSGSTVSSGTGSSASGTSAGSSTQTAGGTSTTPSSEGGSGSTGGSGASGTPTTQTQTSGSFTAKLVPSGSSYWIEVTGVSSNNLTATVSGTDGYSNSFSGTGYLKSSTIPPGKSGINDTVVCKDLNTGETATFNFGF